jgi:SpoVK/Ycf46/Vps4 family AAA+-type ATPase
MTVAQRVDMEKNISLFYEDNYAHVGDELRKLDLLIQRRVDAFRRRIQTMQKILPAQPMYIHHEEVDWLLSHHCLSRGQNEGSESVDRQLELLQSHINDKVNETANRRIFLALPHLAYLFGLSAFELEAVIVCLAPELDRKYDKLYAYLQDDITRKKPSIDLVLNLLCESEAEQWRARTFFSDSAPLFRTELLLKSNDPQSPSGSSGLAQFLHLDSRVLSYLLGDSALDGRLTGIVNVLQPLPSLETVPVDPMIKAKLRRFTERRFSANNRSRKRAILNIHGPYGAGKKELARGVCGLLNCPLVRLDMELLVAEDLNREQILRLAFREGLLLQGALYIDNADVLLKEENSAKALTKKLAQLCNEFGWLTFLAGEKPWICNGTFELQDFLSVGLSIPEVPLRKAAWEHALAPLTKDVTWADQLAAQFHLTPGQIRDAADCAAGQCALSGNEENLTLPDLFKACRSQSNQKLGELALKIDPRYSWGDIVLPEEKLAQLKEICSQVKHRYRVFGEWGFGQKLSHGKGISVLFSGPSGTGKTMAAEVIAHELRLDLYKIDLSGVVSKYIGETEKNLAKVFQEAEASNAILFFDEADALFGKRTEVSDSHDRYANIETSYLLQKMEEYEGVVILATNLRENMDEAFTRRIRFIVEFPFPDEVSRLKIWQTHFPKEAPLTEDIDYKYLSKQFQIAGGNIKNIVLNAAFLAAENGGVISMEHILQGTKREFEKIGKLWSDKIPCKSLGTTN